MRTNPSNREAIDFALDQHLYSPVDAPNIESKKLLQSIGLGLEADLLIDQLASALRFFFQTSFSSNAGIGQTELAVAKSICGDKVSRLSAIVAAALREGRRLVVLTTDELLATGSREDLISQGEHAST